MITVWLLLLGGPVPTPAWSGMVVQVVDGDTIKVLRGKDWITVELFGVDCPEPGQPHADQAKAFTSQVVLSKEVRIEAVPRSTASRVMLGERCLNEELIGAGMAWRLHRDRKWVKLERAAKKAKRGLWADPDPVPPWRWRARRGSDCYRGCLRRNAARAVSPQVIEADCRQRCKKRVVPRKPPPRKRKAAKPHVIEVLRGDRVEQRKVRPSKDSR
jgi:micrococcal nuclease